LKIYHKLTSLFVIVSLVAITLSGYVFFTQGSKAIEERTIAQLESIVVLKENQFDGFIEEEIEDIIDIGEDLSDTLINQEIGKIAYREDIRRSLKENLEEEPDFIELFVLDLDGKVHASTDETQEGKFKSNEPYFVEGKKGTVVQSFYYDLALQQPAMTISTPVKDENGNLIGVLAGRVNLNEISGLMAERSGLGETGETYLVNKFNFMVTESRFRRGLALKKAIYTEGVRDCLKGNSGHGQYNNYRDIPVIGTHVWIPEREVCLLAEIDQEEAFALINTLKNNILLVGIGIVTMVSILSIFLSRRITKPINKLIKGTEEIGKGNMETRINVKTNDEMETLANAFNQTTEDLKKSREELEKYNRELGRRVKERTEELQARVDELEKFHRLTVGRELKMVELKKRIKELEGGSK